MVRQPHDPSRGLRTGGVSMHESVPQLRLLLLVALATASDDLASTLHVNSELMVETDLSVPNVLKTCGVT